jgi:hypothetical protein
MINTQHPPRRRGAMALIAGATLTLGGCLYIALAQSSSHVSTHLYRSPLSRHAFVFFAFYAAVIHLVMLAGLIGLRQWPEVVSSGRVVNVGLQVVIAGTALLFLCELLTIPLVDSAESATSSSIVDSLFGLATVLFTFGMIVAGTTFLRARRWGSWRRYAPLTCGVLSLVVIPMQFSSAAWLGIAIYGLGYAVLGTAAQAESAGHPNAALQAA